MAAVRFWDINMTDVTWCENALYNVALFVFDFSSDDCNTSEKLKQWLCNFIHLFIFFGRGEGGMSGGNKQGALWSMWEGWILKGHYNFVSRVYSSYHGAKEMSIGTESHIQCSTGNQGAKYLKLHRKHGIITDKFIAVEASFWLMHLFKSSFHDTMTQTKIASIVFFTHTLL